MFLFQQYRPRFGVRRVATSMAVVLAVALAGCGGGTRGASSPHKATKTTTTAASVAPRIERLVVAERGTISMVARGGCLATVHTSDGANGTDDELRVRCPRPERLKAWFDGADRVTAGFAYTPTSDEEDDDEIALPAAKVLTSSGKTLKVTRSADVQRLASEVKALATELAGNEEPAPGPESAAGWQMLHVSGPAHVIFAGSPARGVFEARMSTTGQYLCEFVTNVGGEGPMRATKSGWIAPSVASRAIDEVLGPFNATGPNDHPKSTYAAGTKGGAERRTNDSTTAAVFARFAEVQDALGDACLPELEAPSSTSVGL
jgi:hypothetical protein